MDVSVIIVNYKTCDLTIDCIKSVKKHTKNLKYEVILVDNDSNDGSFKRFENEIDDVVLLKSDKNVGFGRANNLGVKYAKGKYIFLLNSDTLLLNNAIFYFFRFFEAYGFKQNIGALGSILLDLDKGATHSSGNFPSMWGFLRKNKLQSIEERFDFEGESCFEVDYITGANLFMSISLFKELNGFDEDFFMYYEESELQHRIKKINKRRIIIDGPQIIHLEGKSIKKEVTNFKRNINLNSKFLYYKKTNFYLSYLLYKSIYIIFKGSSLLFAKNTRAKERKMFFKTLTYNPRIVK